MNLFCFVLVIHTYIIRIISLPLIVDGLVGRDQLMNEGNTMHEMLNLLISQQKQEEQLKKSQSYSCSIQAGNVTLNSQPEQLEAKTVCHI